MYPVAPKVSDDFEFIENQRKEERRVNYLKNMYGGDLSSVCTVASMASPGSMDCEIGHYFNAAERHPCGNIPRVPVFAMNEIPLSHLHRPSMDRSAIDYVHKPTVVEPEVEKFRIPGLSWLISLFQTVKKI